MHWFGLVGVLSLGFGLAACSSSGSGGGNGGGPATGSVVCSDDPQCGGEDCEHVNGKQSGLCVSHCDTNPNACGAGQTCVGDSNIGLQASCLVDCANGSCPGGLVCANSFSGASNVCVPSDWQ